MPKTPTAKLSAEQIDALREKVLRAISPLIPAIPSKKYVVGTDRTTAGGKLPKAYLVYFLLVDLLKFRNFGRFEKVAWSVPVEYEGSFAFIEHRKMGLGIFSKLNPEFELAADKIVQAIDRGVKAGFPFYNHLAVKAVESSLLNVRNNSRWLLARYEFLRDEFWAKTAESESRDKERIRTSGVSRDGGTYQTISWPAYSLRGEASWLGIVAIEAFFSWTEHVLIHIAILRGKIKTGDQVAHLAKAEWAEKVKVGIGLDDKDMKALYDELLSIRRQIRNYIAHGAFGKGGEAFDFHSSAGAVPVNLTDPEGRARFTIGSRLSHFDEGGAILAAEAFIYKLWKDDLAPAKLYLQEANLPLILTLARDGTYKNAMTSLDAMEKFVDSLTRDMDNAANMDW